MLNAGSIGYGLLLPATDDTGVVVWLATELHSCYTQWSYPLIVAMSTIAMA